jgi:2,3-bisphosphoglycerate-dependent phosphoglycerate mutase
MHTLVVIRHGQSEWNKKNLFCGWMDVDLTEQGFQEARQAGELLKKEGYDFDVCFSSILKRAIHTAYTVLDTMDRTWVPVIKNYHLNERHYGALQGKNKTEMTDTYGAEQVHLWRRSYDVCPPALSPEDPRNPVNQPAYRDIKDSVKLPLTECLKDTVARVAPYFDEVIRPEIEKGRRVLVAAHGNSIRALMKHLEGISEKDIAGINVPTGVPLVYEFNDDMTVKNRYFLGDQEAIRAKIEAVKQQSAGSHK